MGQELEIEFKNMLTLEDYELIKQCYFKQSEPFKQTNYYIDTNNHDIMSQKMALRIREKNHNYEMTLKVPQEVGLLEYNEIVEDIPKQGERLNKQYLPENITEILNKFNIPLNDLRQLGDLTTYRLEKDIGTGLLVLDHSIYLGIEDYELEFEVKDYDKGEIAFNKILNDLNIERNIPNNKVVRFFNADRKRT